MRVNLFKTLLGAFLPNGLLEMKEIGAAAKLAYGRLLQYAGERGYCWPSYNTLAGALGMSRSTAIRAVAELVSEHLIEVEPRVSESGDNSSNVFFFLDHAALHSGRLGSSNLTPPSSVLPPLGGVRMPPKKNHKKKIQINRGAPKKQTQLIEDIYASRLQAAARDADEWVQSQEGQATIAYFGAPVNFNKGGAK